MKILLVLILLLVCATPYSQASGYKNFSITSPTNDQGVRANDGNVTVKLSIQPALRSGHTIVLNVSSEGSQSTVNAGGLTVSLKK